MKFDATRAAEILNRPGRIISAWVILSLIVGLAAPNLTRLAAEGQAKLLNTNSESCRAAEIVKASWPNRAYASLVVLALHRDGGISVADREYAEKLARRFEATDRPREVLHVMGPHSAPEIAERLISKDRTVQLIAAALDSHFVAPTTQHVVNWLRDHADTEELKAPAGLEHHWTGDAIIGLDYMAGVQTSLDRAAIATVILLLVVLLVVYRSIWLALVPLATIGISLLIARGVLAWLFLIGWEISPLVELFLVAILFGTGTDFCLFLSWRYAEYFNPRNTAGAMKETLIRSFVALVTSAGTIIVGLMLMGTTKFKLFSSTGPSVALGLVISLLATLTLTPALLIVLAKYRPSAFDGLIRQDTNLWDRIARFVMARPARCWALTLVAMVPLVLLSLKVSFIQDLMTELPTGTPAVKDFWLLSSKFDPGMVAPLAVILESDSDLRTSEGLALIDDVSRLLSHQRRLTEVRSATQPLGSPEPLKRARIASRLGEVNDGFHQLANGAAKLQQGLVKGAAKIQAALWLEERTGLKLSGGIPGLIKKTPSAERGNARSSDDGRRATSPPTAERSSADANSPAWNSDGASGWNLRYLAHTFDALSGGGTGGILTSALPLLNPSRAAGSALVTTREPTAQRLHSLAESGGDSAPGALPEGITPRKRDESVAPTSRETPVPEKPQDVLIKELKLAADGAGQIASGANRASDEVSSILGDPVGKRALDRLLITSQTVRDNPDLNRSFEAYITPDGHRARIDIVQVDRVFSNAAMDQVDVLRRRLKDYLGEYEGVRVSASIAGGNAESADVRTLTRSDQIQSWFVVPVGVFLVLLIALRDPWACMNLVATMVLTYMFALGATHLTFVTILGSPGLDWKVPYFLFVLLVAVGVDYNVFLMTRLQEEARERGLRTGIRRAIAQTGGLISSAAAITACSFASFLFSPLSSLRQLGFALVVGILIDATLVRPLLVPCGHWLLRRSREVLAPPSGPRKARPRFAVFTD